MGTDYKVDIDGKKYSPQEISAMILQKLKADAENYLGCLLYTSISSKSGAGDVLEQLGVNIMMEPEKVEACVDEMCIRDRIIPMDLKAVMILYFCHRERKVSNVCICFAK